MSRHQEFGTITTATEGPPVVARGETTLIAFLDSGTATMTWQFQGPDGVWRDILAGADFQTVTQYTASHMVNVFFGNDVKVRLVTSGVASPQVDWQVLSNVANRG